MYVALFVTIRNFIFYLIVLGASRTSKSQLTVKIASEIRGGNFYISDIFNDWKEKGEVELLGLFIY